MITRLRSFLAAHARARDAVPALVVVLISVPASMATANGAWHAPRPASVAWTALACLPLVWRSRWPVAVTVLCVAVEAAHLFVATHAELVPGASLVALFTVASLRPRHVAWPIGLTAAIGLTTAQSLARSTPLLATGNLVTFDVLVLAIALGDVVRSQRLSAAALRERAEHAEHTREEEAARRVTEERLRIARELHDSVAHHITLVNAQIGVAQHLVKGDPDAAYEVLGQLKDTSRSALDELRAAVGLLRQDGDDPAPRTPIPRLADVEELAASFRSAGLPVEVTRTGEAIPLSSSVELAAYRIIQEALTNAHKHAGPRATARVDLELNTASLQLTVTDTGYGPAIGAADSAGHGLLNMRERAVACGGSFTAGPTQPHGFRVQAELPLLGVPKGNS